LEFRRVLFRSQSSSSSCCGSCLATSESSNSVAPALRARNSSAHAPSELHERDASRGVDANALPLQPESLSEAGTGTGELETQFALSVDHAVPRQSASRV